MQAQGLTGLPENWPRAVNSSRGLAGALQASEMLIVHRKR